MKTNAFGLVEADTAAEAIGVSRRHLIDVLKKDIPYIRKGKRIMFDAKDLKQYIEREKVRPEMTK